MSFVFETSRDVERVERRVLGALCCVDATTGTPLNQALRVGAPAGARIQRNRSGLFVIHDWAPLAHHSSSFLNAPAGPPVGDTPLTVTISDPSGQYLSRLVQVDVPRDPVSASVSPPNSLFRPLMVPMYPSAAARIGPNWAALSLSLRDALDGDALGGVLLRVLNGSQVVARGLSDWRGEALVPVAGIPVTTWSAEPGDVIVTQIEVTVEAFADPASMARTLQVDVSAGRAPLLLPLVDPVAMETARAGLPQASTVVSLAAGRRLHVSLEIPLP
ncbi:hypothetical protein [Hydrogenophaga sp.]|uniref:hypothetical protein n=1 Tax=Hydrogenophaga sp. TaxID=1904254 RepID=UPI002724E4E6|nr:hypothetical protein [Hydrogenophaga sp.]MDO9437346.1 hypothetical protein [Hydrogenophaga sp.]